MSGLAHPTDRFRPDLEGLRAVAVVVVLLYHARIPGFGGGYVGVDVFFVLSGFLITGLIYRELRTTGTVDLAAFYARRARRLLPAAALVLLVTLAASVVILPSLNVSTVSQDIASAGLYVSNVRFGFQANDYFQATADPSPVLHFWSLSVEEQFYIFWPAALLAAQWLPIAAAKRARITGAIVVIGLASLAAGVWLTGVNQPWAFFLLPTRAWELAIGGLIAVHARELAGLPRRLMAVATPLGIALVLAASVLFDNATPFPGIAALLPVAGSVLVIVGGLPEVATASRRVLSIAPLRYLGRISYSLYLWHWPMIVLGTAMLGESAAPLLALAAIGPAALSQRLIEQPMRFGRLIGSKPVWNLVQAAGAGGIILAVSYAVSSSPTNPVASSPEPGAGSTPTARSTQPLPSSPDEGRRPAPCADCTIDDLEPPLAALDTGFFPDCPLEDVADPTKCVLGSPASSRVIAIFGDSFAWHLVPAFDHIGKTHDVRVLNLVRSACPSATVAVWSRPLRRADTECDEWRERALARIEGEQPAVIVLSNSNSEILLSVNGEQVPPERTLDGAHPTLLKAGLEQTLARLGSLEAPVFVIGQPPHPTLAGLDPPACLVAHPTDFQAACRGLRSSMIDRYARVIDESAVAETDAAYVDLSPWLCDPLMCPAVIDRIVVYRDLSGHLTAAFALTLADRLAQAIGIAEP